MGSKLDANNLLNSAVSVEVGGLAFVWAEEGAGEGVVACPPPGGCVLLGCVDLCGGIVGDVVCPVVLQLAAEGREDGGDRDDVGSCQVGMGEDRGAEGPL